MIRAPRLGTGSPRLRGLGLAISVAALVMGALLLADRALAEQPFRLTSQIEDRAGALAGREPAVRAAFDDLLGSEHVELWLVYVETFSGIEAGEWALRTFDASGLGVYDLLLAVAVEDRNYYYVVDDGFPLTDAQLDKVMATMVEPALRENDWAAAAIAAAEGVAGALSPVVATTVATTAATTATTSPTSTTGTAEGAAAGSAGDGDGFNWTLVFALAVLAIVAAIVWARLRSARRRQIVEDADLGGGVERAMTLKELRQRVASQLVQTDDAIKTSTEEVGFAIAEFGEKEAAPFQKALDEARRELDEAFKLHRQFDEKADEQTQRHLLAAVLQHTGAANAKLDAQVERFDKLRDLEKQAPQLFAALEKQVADLEGRMPIAKEELAALAGVYSLAALKSVASNPAEAASRLVFVREQMRVGLKAISAGQTGVAAVAALAAQEAAGQAAAFLDAVGRVGKDLAEAQGRIDAAIAETERDIAEARIAAEGPHGSSVAARLAPLVATAQSAVAAASAAAAPEGGRDPLAALRHIEEADAALDTALQQVRDESAQRARAALALDRTMVAARAQVSATADYITTHRGAVGSQPRALLAEAQGALDQAVVAAGSDPLAATRWASQAHELAGRALDQAQKETRYATSMTGRPGSEIGAAVVGAILGGILASSRGGGAGGGSGGGPFGGGLLGGLFGGGSFGGGGMGGSPGRRSSGGSFGKVFGSSPRSGRSLAPPSFGGTGTRMRRGSGGRF